MTNKNFIIYRVSPYLFDHGHIEITSQDKEISPNLLTGDKNGNYIYSIVKANFDKHNISQAIGQLVYLQYKFRQLSGEMKKFQMIFPKEFENYNIPLVDYLKQLLSIEIIFI